MIGPALAAYLAFTFVLVVTPGSTTAVVVRNVLGRGRRAGLAAAAGAALGNTSHATAAGLGLAALFARAPYAFTLLRIGGALYLAWLGVMNLATAWSARADTMPGALENRARAASFPALNRSQSDLGSAFREGVVANLLNPAIVTFYLTVVPSFLPSPRDVRARFTLLAAIHITMAFVCHSAWALAFDAMRALWARPAARRTLETLTGLALLGLAARVAAG